MAKKYASLNTLQTFLDNLKNLFATKLELSGKANTSHTHDDRYDTKGAASDALASANTYTDNKTSGLASTSSVNTSINNHNTSTSAHSDIRELISGLTTRLNTLANSDDITLDQMSEIVAYIKNNKSLIDGVTTAKVNVSDIINNLTTNVTNKPLSAAQGVEIKKLIDALQEELNSHTHVIGDITNLQSTLNGKVPTSRTVNGKALSADITLSASDVGADASGSATSALSSAKTYTDNAVAQKTQVQIITWEADD